MELRFHKSEFYNKSLVWSAHASLCSPPIREELRSKRENRVVTKFPCFNTAHSSLSDDTRVEVTLQVHNQN